MFSQIAAVAIFVVMFAMIVWDKVERQIVTLFSGLATIVFVFIFGMHSKEAIFNTLNIKAIFTTDFWYHVGQGGEESSGINWATIIFIFGMMVMVEGLAEAGFFNLLCMAIAKLVHYEPIPIFIAFMVMSAVLSMFIDSITVILFLAAITIELSRVIYFDPVPVIMAEIFCANLGGSATMCGDPPNIIIGTSLGYTFMDFLENTGVCAAISLVVIVFYFYLCFKKKLSSNNWAIKHASKEDVERITEEIREDEEMDNGPADIMSVTNIKYFYISSAIFGLAIVLLITHATTGLTVAFIGTLIAILTLLAAGRNALELLKRVDYKTLLFFVGLFVVVGGLEETGVLVMIADFIGNISGGNILLLLFFLFPLELLLTVLLLFLPLYHLYQVNINTITTIKIAKPILISTSLPAGFSSTSSSSMPCFLPTTRTLRSLGIR